MTTKMLLLHLVWIGLLVRDRGLRLLALFRATVAAQVAEEKGGTAGRHSEEYKISRTARINAYSG